jgi:hypothetical protein
MACGVRDKNGAVVKKRRLDDSGDEESPKKEV